ncbi:BNR repeat-containing protein [Sphingomonas sanxanigenens]|uniref:BNR repeat-containing family member n=1 Tax=Sphingomonas sanxanigenens DSM 19645 = NX02 TaxID=1123269 RepID=W0A477_9SPHN|nr:BNR repeat-containing protein [Sphingomonas sanxanigenens]AHE52764.1 hypothetical protein NX02_05120 [Sphingomonas sanxanigenens DSM 19645 = NX02]
MLFRLAVAVALFTATLTAPLAAQAADGCGAEAAPARGATVSAIDRVWSGHAARFALVVTDTRIFVGYYDANRQLSIAARPRDADDWTYHKVDSWLGWDSHNSIAMAVDEAGQLHVVGNLHRDPLVYFRTTGAGDVRTLRREAVMVDAARERRMTYPIFLRDAERRLILKYRDGGSGNGNEIYNVYDAAAARWRPLLQTPLTDGEGKRNAYFMGPVSGPDGRFHIAWVWRDTPMAETNHDLSYARSTDLVHWERSDGRPLALPIRLDAAEIVDPVPVKGGMINNNTVIGFDPAGRVMISYHKFDAAGDTQIHVARRDAKGWTRARVSDWKGFRWDFGGGGSLDSRLVVEGARPVGKDRICVPVIRDGRRIDFLLDAATLERVAELPGQAMAERLAGRVAVPAGMQLNSVEDPGGSGILLAWPTRPPHRDLPSEDIPEPTVLRLLVPR